MKKMLCVVFSGLLSASLQAEVVSYDFRGNGGDFDFEVATGQITTNGITMDFSAFDPETNAVLNAATYFGVNSDDDSDTDTVEIGQYITIEFSSGTHTEINLQTITAGAWISGDGGYYQIDSGPQVALVNGANNLSPSVNVLGKKLTFATTAGNGISFNGITVETVPEPATMAFLGIGGLLTLIIRRASRI